MENVTSTLAIGLNGLNGRKKIIKIINSLLMKINGSLGLDPRHLNDENENNDQFCFLYKLH